MELLKLCEKFESFLNDLKENKILRIDKIKHIITINPYYQIILF